MIFGNFGSTAGDVIVEQVSAMVAVQQNLYAAVRGKGTTLATAMQNWQYMANQWWDPARTSRAASDPQVLRDWERMGRSLISGASEIASQARDTGLVNMIASFARTFPAALSKVTSATIQGVGGAATQFVNQAGRVTQEAGKGIGATVLLVAGAAALGLWMLQKSGASIRLPWLSVGK